MNASMKRELIFAIKAAITGNGLFDHKYFKTLIKSLKTYQTKLTDFHPRRSSMESINNTTMTTKVRFNFFRTVDKSRCS